MKLLRLVPFKWLAALLLFGASGSLHAITVSCTLNTPINGATFSTSCSGETITLDATAFASIPVNCPPPTNCPPQIVPVNVVYFYANGVEIGMDSSASSGNHFSYVWTLPGPGTYELYAVGDYGDNLGFSATHTITVTGIDSDGDGLHDCAELNTHNTDPDDPDTDGDGLTDGQEVNVCDTDPLVSDASNNYKNGNVDSFNGFAISWIIHYWGVWNGIYYDADEEYDDLLNYEEYQANTNPCDIDTDDDGYCDGEELKIFFTDPLDPESP